MASYKELYFEWSLLNTKDCQNWDDTGMFALLFGTMLGQVLLKNFLNYL